MLRTGSSVKRQGQLYTLWSTQNNKTYQAQLLLSIDFEKAFDSID